MSSRSLFVSARKKGTASHINSFELGQHGRYRTNVWSYKGMNSFGGARNEEIKLHPTVKPVTMIVDAIKDVSNRNGIVLDLFGGSGSTLIAAHKTGRRGFLCELDPFYCDRIVRRWQVFAKDDAILESSGRSFEDVRLDRQHKSRELGPPLSSEESSTSRTSEKAGAGPGESEVEQMLPVSLAENLPICHEARRWDGWHD